jgi:hypothetical protein
VAGPTAVPQWQPWDAEKPLADYTPPADVPSLDEVRQTVAVPDVPYELPAVAWLLEQFVKESLDPWNLPLDRE